ncbi:MAG: uroporphyrinogen-III synthase, partial [Myxococcota bacterium]
LERAVRELSRYDALCFTSVAGVERFLHRLRAAGRDLRELSPQALVAAVGPATAEALVNCGVHVDVIGTAGGEVLADALHAALPLGGRRVLLPRAEGGREEFQQRAEALGAEVVVVDAYRAVPREGLHDAVKATLAAIETAPRPVVLMTSPRRVELFTQGLEDADRLTLARARLIAIGPTTKAALDAAGLAPSMTLATSSPQALIDALLPSPVETPS